MARILQIAQLGHPVLREHATPVADISSSEIQDLIDDLIATVVDAEAAGIAAPQAFVSKRVFIVSSTPSARFPNRPKMDPTPVINPEIVSMSDDTATFWEGCLSVPGVRCLVPRATTIRIAYSTREGKRVEREYSDYVARVFQHEYDHLEGTIFFDRIENNRDIITEKEFLKLQVKILKEGQFRLLSQIGMDRGNGNIVILDSPHISPLFHSPHRLRSIDPIVHSPYIFPFFHYLRVTVTGQTSYQHPFYFICRFVGKIYI